MIKCEACGSTARGDEFADGTGYECPRCFSNVCYHAETIQTSEYDVRCTDCGLVSA